MKKKNQRRVQKLQKKMLRTNNALKLFINQTIKNYKTMKTKIAKIWCVIALLITITSCNVTRQITNESQYYQKGDTSVVIQTKTIETYNAEKK